MRALRLTYAKTHLARRALTEGKSVARHVKLSPQHSRIVSATPRREAGAMDLATEVRLQKRRTLLAYIENTPEFLAASAAARATRPEPEDFTKRQWERALGL